MRSTSVHYTTVTRPTLGAPAPTSQLRCRSQLLPPCLRPRSRPWIWLLLGLDVAHWACIFAFHEPIFDASGVVMVAAGEQDLLLTAGHVA